MTKYTEGVANSGRAHFVIRSKQNETAPLSGDLVGVTPTIARSSARLRHKRIAADPEVLSGAPHIRGTRIPISVILEGLAEGLNSEQLIEHYPRLTREDIEAVLEYATEMAL